MFKNVFDRFKKALVIDHPRSLQKNEIPVSPKINNIQSTVRKSIALIAGSVFALGAVDGTQSTLNSVNFSELNTNKPTHELFIPNSITNIKTEIGKQVAPLLVEKNKPVFKQVTPEYKDKGPIEWLMREYGLSMFDAAKAWPNLVSTDGQLIQNPKRDFMLGKAYYLAPTLVDAQKIAIDLKGNSVLANISIDSLKKEQSEKILEPKKMKEKVAQRSNSEVSGSLGKLKEIAMQDPLLQKSLLSYSQARGLSVDRIIAEYGIFKDRFHQIDKPTHSISLATKVEDNLNQILGEQMTAQDYALSIASLETSARRILDGPFDETHNINGARKYWKVYQETKSSFALSDFNAHLDGIVRQAVGPGGDSGNYRFIYSTALNVANGLGFKIEKTAFGCQFSDGNKTYRLMKDRNLLKMAIKKAIEDGVAQNQTDSQIEESLQKIDSRLDNALMKVFTQASLSEAYGIIKARFGKNITHDRCLKIAMLAHNKGIGGAIQAAQQGSINQTYLNKVYGLASLAGLDTHLSKSSQKIQTSRVESDLILNSDPQLKKPETVSKTYRRETALNLPINFNSQKQESLASKYYQTELNLSSTIDSKLRKEFIRREIEKMTPQERLVAKNQIEKKAVLGILGQHKEPELTRFILNNLSKRADDYGVLDLVQEIVPDQTRKIAHLKTEFHNLPASIRMKNVASFSENVVKMESYKKKAQNIVDQVSTVLASDDYYEALAA